MKKLIKRLLKVVAVLLVLLVVGVAFGAGPVLGWSLRRGGTALVGAPVNVGSVSFSVFGAELEIRDLRIGDPSHAGEDIFVAQRIHADLSVWDLVGGQVVIPDLSLDGPELHVVRTGSGRLNVEAFLPPEGGSGTLAQMWDEHEAGLRAQGVQALTDTDWVTRLRELFASRADSPAAEAGTPGTAPADTLVAASAKPDLVVRRVAVTGLRVTFKDSLEPAGVPALTGFAGELTEVSDAPSLHDQPIHVKLAGSVEGRPEATLTADLDLDLRAGDPSSARRGGVIVAGDVAAHSLVLADLQHLWRRSAGVDFTTGEADVDLRLGVRGQDLDSGCTAALRNVEIQAKPGVDRLAGLEADRVVQGINALRDFDLDVDVGGTLRRPRLDWKGNIARLVEEGLKRVGKEKVQEEAERLKEKVEERLGEDLDEVRDKARDRLRGMFGR